MAVGRNRGRLHHGCRVDHGLRVSGCGCHSVPDHFVLMDGSWHLNMPHVLLSVNHLLDPLDRLDDRAWNMFDPLDGVDLRHMPDDLLNVGHWHVDMPDDFLSVNHLLDPLDRLDDRARHMLDDLHGVDPRYVPHDFLNVGHWHVNMPDDFLSMDHMFDPLDGLDLRHMNVLDAFHLLESGHMDDPLLMMDLRYMNDSLLHMYLRHLHDALLNVMRHVHRHVMCVVAYRNRLRTHMPVLPVVHPDGSNASVKRLTMVDPDGIDTSFGIATSVPGCVATVPCSDGSTGCVATSMSITTVPCWDSSVTTVPCWVPSDSVRHGNRMRL